MFKKCAQAFCLTEQQTKVIITGIGAMGNMLIQLYSIMVFCQFNNFEITLLPYHILPKTTVQLPIEVMDVGKLCILGYVREHLTDPSYGKLQSVDMLLGLEIFFELL